MFLNRLNKNKMDIKKFQESITRELDIIKNRVRNLIGNSNWGEEGRYKEAILRNIIRRFLPSNVSIGTGFIIKKDGDNYRVSKQIDIILYDNKTPVLFSEGDFVVTTCKNVKGIVEVKTSLRGNNFEDIVNKAEENGELIGKKIFNGIFFYEYDNCNDAINSETIEDALKKAKGYLNHISLGPHTFIKFWKKENRHNANPLIEKCQGDFYNIYCLENLSFSYFISNLLEYVCLDSLDDRWWYLYPIDKESKEKKTIYVERR